MSPKATQFAPDSAATLERSRGVIFSQWEELLRLRRAVMKTCALDDIHDLRVASRRFRAALELYSPFASKVTVNELRESIRNLTRILGVLRNIDEAEHFFRSRTSADVQAGIRLFQSLSDLRSMELRRVKKALKAFDPRSLDRHVREVVAGLNDDSISVRNRFSLLAYFSNVSIRLYLPIHQLLAVSAASQQRASRHTLRIAIKKWRYFFEIVAEILDRDYTHVLGQLKEYQSILGRMNDIAEFEVLLGKLSLSRNERSTLEEILRAEDALLFEDFKGIVERKPLAYKFLM